MTKAFEERLVTMGRYLGIVPPPREKKRVLPRGTLRRPFWDKQFREVQDIIEDWGFEVELGTRVTERVELGEVKTIYINSATHPETRFYTLLHEVGHILIRKNWKRFIRHYPNYMQDPNEPHDSRREKRKSYRIGVLAEEIEAWKRGMNFAARHNFYVDPLKYDSDANTALMSYVSWISGISEAQAAAGKRSAKARKRRLRTTKAGRRTRVKVV